MHCLSMQGVDAELTELSERQVELRVFVEKSLLARRELLPTRNFQVFFCSVLSLHSLDLFPLFASELQAQRTNHVCLDVVDTLLYMIVQIEQKNPVRRRLLHFVILRH